MADSVKTANSDELARFVKYYEASAEATQDARARADRDQDYYDHKQLSDTQISELTKRKQAPTIVNFVQKNVNYLLGLERQNRTDPKAYPRTPIHEDAAHAASDSIRYICEENLFDVKASAAYKELLVQGLCAAVIEAKPIKLNDYKITIHRIPWGWVFYDPHSYEEDFSDASYKGYIKWMDLEKAKELGKQHGYTGDFSSEDSQFAESTNDKPSYKTWYDGSRKRVKVCFIWYMEKGTWMHAIFSKAGMIWGPEPSPYVDDEGEPECNFVIQSSLVDRENNRYGYVRSMISQQDAINKRESKSLHLLSQRQTWSKAGAFRDVNKAKKELAKPDGHIEVNEGAEMGRDFGILDTGDMAQGQFLLLQEAKNDLNAVAASGSVADSPGSASGRALEARAESGNTELTPFTDAHKQWKIRIYRCAWNKVRQFWNEEKWIRVTDDENNLQWVGLNTPITLAEQMIAEQTGESPVEIKKKYVNELTQLIQQDPGLGELVETQNNTTELDVDIIIEEVPNVINFQNEQFIQIAKLAERRGDIPTNLLIKMSSLRNKEQILSEIEGDDKQKEAQAQEQAQANEMQLRLASAEATEKEASAEKSKQEAIQKMLENQLIQQQSVEASLVI